MVVASCGLFAIKKVQAGRRAIQAERDMHGLFMQLSRRISFGLVPLPELIDELCQSKSAQGYDFLEKARALALEEGCYQTAWQKAVDWYQNEKGISKETTELLFAVGRQLGTMDGETETERLVQAAKTLEELIDEEETEFKKTEKTTISIGFLGGIFVVILFL